MKSKKKIIFFIGSMIAGGVEKSLVELLNVLDYEKYIVTVCLKDNSGDMRELINPKAIIKLWDDNCTMSTQKVLISQFCRFQLWQGLIGIFNRILARKYRNFYELGIWYSVKCMAPIDNEIYDYAIAYHDGDNHVVANTIYRIRAKRKILWVHSRVIREENLLNFYDREYAKFNYVICVSETVRQFFEGKYPKAAKRTLVIHNCINSQMIRKLADGAVDDILEKESILTVGRLSKEKGQDMIPKTARLLLDMGYKLVWYVVGEGDLRKTIETEIVKYNVKNNVILLGAKLNPYPYMKLCDIYVQPSLSEGCCVAVEEAKILHKPMVVTGDPSFNEQITNGVTGMIATGKSPEALCVCIAKLLESNELREKIVKNLQNKEYNNHEEMQVLYDIFDE